MLGLPEGVVACLFDLDGVLTQTATVHRTAWKATFDPMVESPFTEDDYLRYVDGKPRGDGVRDFLASRGITADDDLVRETGDRKNALLLEAIATHGVDVYDGSRRYLQACADAGLRRAVVSSSANTEQVLDVTGLAALIELRVDGVTAVQRSLKGKPAPDTFLAAASDLGLRPVQCAVFEDALAGVAAGRAGGFGAVIGVDRAGQADALAANGATSVVQDLEELL